LEVEQLSTLCVAGEGDGGDRVGVDGGGSGSGGWAENFLATGVLTSPG
jgi:hypothetical protein